jgi:hypothetical protein
LSKEGVGSIGGLSNGKNAQKCIWTGVLWKIPPENDILGLKYVVFDENPFFGRGGV